MLDHTELYLTELILQEVPKRKACLQHMFMDVFTSKNPEMANMLRSACLMISATNSSPRTLIRPSITVNAKPAGTSEHCFKSISVYVHNNKDQCC